VGLSGTSQEYNIIKNLFMVVQFGILITYFNDTQGNHLDNASF